MNTTPKLHVIKVERDDTDLIKLTKDRVIYNIQRGVETSLIVDVNIIYSVRDVFLKKETYENSGISQFMNMVNSTCAGIVSGIALREIPLGIRNECRDIFDMFLTEFCGVTDHPTAVKTDLDSENNKDFLHKSGFFVEHEAQCLFYYYVVKIHQIWLRMKGAPRVEMYRTFVSEVISEIDFVSALEFEIAKYCFCDDQEANVGGGYSNLAAKKIAVIRKNFLGAAKKNRTLEGRFHVIRNSVRDLLYIQYSRFADISLSSTEEFWVATFDGKLAEILKHFCMLSHKGLSDLEPTLSMFPQLKSNFGYLERPYEINKKPYWQGVDQITFDLARERMVRLPSPIPENFIEQVKYNLSRNIDEICQNYPSTC